MGSCFRSSACRGGREHYYGGREGVGNLGIELPQSDPPSTKMLLEGTLEIILIHQMPNLMTGVELKLRYHNVKLSALSIKG